METPFELKTKDGKKITIPDDLRKPGVHFGVQVTPDVAAYFLEVSGKEFHNRQVNHERVDTYGRDMGNHDWQHNGETIKFDSSGILVDGYTRLTAAFMHSVEFTTDVATGVSKAAIATIDTGRPRSLANVLAMRNEATATALAQGARWLMDYELGHIHTRSKTKKSHAEMAEFIDNHPELRDAVEWTKEIRNKKIAPPGVLVATYYICVHSNRAKAVEFFGLLASGVGLTPGSAVKHLRDILLQREQRRLQPSEAFAFILHAFNKYVSGEVVRLLKLPSKDSIPVVKRVKAK